MSASCHRILPLRALFADSEAMPFGISAEALNNVPLRCFSCPRVVSCARSVLLPTIDTYCRCPDVDFMICSVHVPQKIADLKYCHFDHPAAEKSPRSTHEYVALLRRRQPLKTEK